MAPPRTKRLAMWRSLRSELCFVLVFQLTTWLPLHSLEIPNEATGVQVEGATFLASSSSNCPDPFVQAVKGNRDKEVKELLAKDATLKTCVTSFQTTFMPSQVTGLALHLAADLGFAKVLRSLLDGGVDPNAPTTSGGGKWWPPQSTALMFAAVSTKTLEAVRILLGAPGIEVYAQSQNGLSALILAACRGNAEVVQLLVNTDASGVNLQSQAGKNALMEASQRGHREVVKVLIEVDGIDLNLKIPEDAIDYPGYTALMLSLLKTEASSPKPEWTNLPTCRPHCPNVFEGIVKVGGTNECADCTADIVAQEPCCTITLENGEPVCLKDGDIWYGGNSVSLRQCADQDWGCYLYLSSDHAAENRACADRMLATRYFPDKNGFFWWHDAQPKQKRPEDRVCGTCHCCMRTEDPQFIPNDLPICGPDVKLGQVAVCEVPSNEKLKGLVLTDALGNKNCDKCQIKYDGSWENEKNCECKLSCPPGTVGTATSMTCQKSGKNPTLTPVGKCNLYDGREKECLTAGHRDEDDAVRPCCWVPSSSGAASGTCVGLGSPQMPKVPAQCARMWGTDWEVKDLPTCTPLCELSDATKQTYNDDLKLEFPDGFCSGKKPGELCEVKCQDGYEYGGGTEFGDFNCTVDRRNRFKASFPDPPVCQKTAPPKPCDVEKALGDFPLVETEKGCKECSGDCKKTCGKFKCKDGSVPNPTDAKGREGSKKCVVETKPKGSRACTTINMNKYDCLKSMDPMQAGVPCCFMPTKSRLSKSGVCASKGSEEFKRKRGAGPIVCADASNSVMEDLPTCTPLCEWDKETEQSYTDDLKLEFPGGPCSGKQPGELCEVECKDGYEYGGGTEFRDFKCTVDQEDRFKAFFPDPPVCQKSCDGGDTLRANKFPFVVTEEECNECRDAGTSDCKMCKCIDGYVLWLKNCELDSRFATDLGSEITEQEQENEATADGGGGGRACWPKLTTIMLTRNPLGADLRDPGVFAKGLTALPALEELDLERCDLDSSFAMALGSAMLHKDKEKEATAGGGKGQSQSCWPKLKMLKLDQNTHLGAELQKPSAFAKGLAALPALEELHLIDCDLDSSFATALGSAMLDKDKEKEATADGGGGRGCWPKLKNIVLAFNERLGTDLPEPSTFAKGLTVLPALEGLVLPKCSLNSSFATALGSAMLEKDKEKEATADGEGGRGCWPKLKNIVLEQNTLLGAELQKPSAFAKGLAALPALEMLNLKQCGLGDDFADALLSTLTAGAWPALTTLSLKNNEFSHEKTLKLEERFKQERPGVSLSIH